MTSGDVSISTADLSTSPAQVTPLTALKFAELTLKAGFPPWCRERGFEFLGKTSNVSIGTADVSTSSAQVTPLTALKFAELTLKAGFPPGVVNVVWNSSD